MATKRSVQLTLMVLLLVIVLLAACSGDATESTTGNGGSGSAKERSIQDELLSSCESIIRNCAAASVSVINTPELTQNERNDGIEDRVCGTVTFEIPVGEAIKTVERFAIFDRDQLGWHGLYADPDWDYFVDDARDPIRSDTKKKLWASRNCSREEEFESLEQRIREANELSELASRYSGLVIDGSADDWSNEDCPHASDPNDDALPAWLDLKSVCAKVNDDYVMLLMETRGALSGNTQGFGDPLYVVLLADSDDANAATSGALITYSSVDDHSEGIVMRNQQAISEVYDIEVASAGSYLEWAIPRSEIRRALSDAAFMTVSAVNPETEQGDSIDEFVSLWP